MLASSHTAALWLPPTLEISSAMIRVFMCACRWVYASAMEWGLSVFTLICRLCAYIYTSQGLHIGRYTGGSLPIYCLCRSSTKPPLMTSLLMFQSNLPPAHSLIIHHRYISHLPSIDTRSPSDACGTMIPPFPSCHVMATDKKMHDAAIDTYCPMLLALSERSPPSTCKREYIDNTGLQSSMK